MPRYITCHAICQVAAAPGALRRMRYGHPLECFGTVSLQHTINQPTTQTMHTNQEQHLP